MGRRVKYFTNGDYEGTVSLKMEDKDIREKTDSLFQYLHFWRLKCIVAVYEGTIVYWQGNYSVVMAAV